MLTSFDHSCLLAERVQNVLVVTPQGDAAGYSAVDLTQETSTLTRVIRTGREITAVVVDLGLSEYFGSSVIGAVAQLAEAIREKGGRCIAAGASQDMRDVLAVMQIDTLLEFKRDRRTAVLEVADRPSFVRLKKPLLILGAILLLGGIGYGLSQSNITDWFRGEASEPTAAETMQELKVLYVEFRQEAAKAPGGNNLTDQQLRNRFSNRLDPIIERLKRYEDVDVSASDEKRAYRELLLAAQTALRPMFQTPRSGDNAPLVEKYQGHMAQADRFLRG